MLSDEGRQRVIDALENAAQELGSTNLAEATTILEKATQMFAEMLVHLRTRESLDVALQRLEIAPEEEEKFIATLEGTARFVNFVAPRVFKYVDAIAMVQAGRPKALSGETEKAACEYAGKLFTEGVELGTAKDRAAQKFGVSRSTIERAWMNRKRKKKLSFREVYEIIFK